MKYLVDTNVLKQLGRSDRHENVASWLRTVNDSDLAVSTITVREVWAGITKLGATKREVAEKLAISTKSVFDAFGDRVLPVDGEVAQLWGMLLGGSRKHVDDIGLVATAKKHSLLIVTRNIDDFEGYGVTLLDPYKSLPTTT